MRVARLHAIESRHTKGSHTTNDERTNELPHVVSASDAQQAAMIGAISSSGHSAVCRYGSTDSGAPQRFRKISGRRRATIDRSFLRAAPGSSPRLMAGK